MQEIDVGVKLGLGCVIRHYFLWLLVMVVVFEYFHFFLQYCLVFSKVGVEWWFWRTVTVIRQPYRNWQLIWHHRAGNILPAPHSHSHTILVIVWYPMLVLGNYLWSYHLHGNPIQPFPLHSFVWRSQGFLPVDGSLLIFRDLIYGKSIIVRLLSISESWL